MHYVVADRPKFTEEQGKLFVNLFADKTLSELAQLHYIEGKTLLECAEIMNYSQRQTERMHNTLKNIAIVELMNLVGGENDNAQKLLQIRKIIYQGYDNESSHK